MRRHPIFSNTIINIINTIISFVIAYAMTPIILHRMGTENYGVWVFLGIFSISGYFSLLDFGLQGAAIKYVAEYKSKNNTKDLQGVVSATLSFFLLAGIVGGILLFLFNTFFFHSVFNIPASQAQIVSVLINVLALSFIFQFPAIAFSSIIEGLQRYDYLRGVSILTTIVSNIAIFIYLKNDNSLVAMMFISLATSLIITFAYGILTKKLLPEIRLTIFSIKKETVKILFSLSSKLFASKIVGLIFNNTDKILIGIFLSVGDQTKYDIVNKLHVIILSLLGMFNQALLPATSEFSAKKDEQGLRDLLLRATKYASVAVLPSFFFLFFFPSELLRIWVGANYVSLSPLLQIYIFHFIVTMLVGISSTMLVGINKVGQVLKISIIAALLNLGISAGTVHFLGIKGLILGTTIAYLISSTIYIFVCNRIFKIPNIIFFKKTISPLLPASIITITAILIIKPLLSLSHLPSLLILIAAIYGLFALIFYFTGLDDYEKKLSTQLLSKFGSFFSRT